MTLIRWISTALLLVAFVLGGLLKGEFIRSGTDYLTVVAGGCAVLGAIGFLLPLSKSNDAN
jgi:hypothetical protein